MVTYNASSWPRRDSKSTNDARQRARNGSISSKTSTLGRIMGKRLLNRGSIQSGIDIDEGSDSTSARPSTTITSSIAETEESDLNGSVLDEVNGSIPSSMRSSHARSNSDQDFSGSMMDEVNASVPSSRRSSISMPRRGIDLDRSHSNRSIRESISTLSEVVDLPDDVSETFHSEMTAAIDEVVDIVDKTSKNVSSDPPMSAVEDATIGSESRATTRSSICGGLPSITRRILQATPSTPARRHRRRAGRGWPKSLLKDGSAGVIWDTPDQYVTMKGMSVSDMLHLECPFPVVNTLRTRVPNKGELDTSHIFYEPKPDCEALQSHVRDSSKLDSAQFRVKMISEIRCKAVFSRDFERLKEAQIPSPCKLHGPPTYAQFVEQAMSHFARKPEPERPEKSATEWIDAKLKSFNPKDYHSVFGRPLHSRIRELQRSVRGANAAVFTLKSSEILQSSKTLQWMSGLDDQDRSTAAKLLEEAQKIKKDLVRLEVKMAALGNKNVLSLPSFGKEQSRKVWHRMASTEYWHLRTNAFINMQMKKEEANPDEVTEQSDGGEFYDEPEAGIDDVESSDPADAVELPEKVEREKQESGKQHSAKEGRVGGSKQPWTGPAGIKDDILCIASSLRNEVDESKSLYDSPSWPSVPRSHPLADTDRQLFQRQLFELSNEAKLCPNVSQSPSVQRERSVRRPTHGRDNDNREARPETQRARRFRMRASDSSRVRFEVRSAAWSPQAGYRSRRSVPQSVVSAISDGERLPEAPIQITTKRLPPDEFEVASNQGAKRISGSVSVSGGEPVFEPSVVQDSADPAEESVSRHDQDDSRIAPLSITKVESVSTVVESSAQAALRGLSEKARGKLPQLHEPSAPTTPKPMYEALEDERFDSAQKDRSPGIKIDFH
ncbi:hypothetical protein FB567DRAFT_548957 [Paraphoma chrysanthemicola]|uniref:Uncharacterized protein n=1 Tax=Paraphoma chrysanthemicola TaxID=798071 RepID=A0A8K0R949_9PLEO|nr:hypothetical protein FB567DRAFT_548957 [Paraphoma chrysanthemicola]